MRNRWMMVAVAGLLGLGLMAGAGLAQESTESTTKAKPKGPIRQRQKNQQKRIGEGIESGQITPREGAKLEKKEAELNREIRRDRKDGKGLTPRERRKINKQQDKLSREIYKEKHDEQKVPPAKKQTKPSDE